MRVVAVPQRSYPGGNTASHLIGYTDIDNKGQTGIELAADALLAGRPGLQLVVKSALPGHSRLLTRPLRAPVPGATIETTIDRDLQFMVERELADAVERHDAAGGAVIVMDPLTGEILALANHPTFDLNEYTVATDETEAQSRGAAHLRAGLDLQVVHRRGGARSAAHADVAHVRHQRRLHQLRPAADPRHAPLPGAVVHGRHRQVEQRRRHQDRPGAGLGRRQPLRVSLRLRRDAGPRHPAPARRPRRQAAAAVQAERAGVGVDGLPDRRHAAADGGGGRIDRQRRRADRAARRARDDRRRRPHRRAAAGRPAHDFGADRRRADDDPRAGGRARHGQAGAHPRLHHRRQDRHRREARERPLLEGPQQRVVRRLRAVAAPARGDPRHPRLAAPRRPHRRRSGGADLPRRRRGDAAPAGRAAHRARSARPAGRAERAGRADAGQPAGDRARADPRRGAGRWRTRRARSPTSAACRPARPRACCIAPASSRGCRAAAWSSASGRQPARSSAPARPATWCSSVASRKPIRSAGSNHDPGAAPRTDVVARRPRSRRAARRRRSRASGRRRRVRFAPRRGRQRVRRDEGREGRRRRLRPAGAREGRVRGGGGSAGAGRLDAAVGPRRRRSRRAGGAGGGVLRPSERRPARRRHHRDQRQDDDQLSDGGDLRRGRRPLRPPRHGLLRRRRHRARGAPDDAGSDRLPADAARDGDQRLRRLRRRGVVARAGAEARRPRPLRRRRLHQPDPRSPRLPPRHGLVLRGQAPAVRPAAGRRDGGGERRRSLRPRAGRDRSSAASRSASTSPPTSTPGRSTSRSTA